MASSPSASDRLLDVKQAAALLHVPKSWIYQHVRARTDEKFPHFKLGKYIRFSAKALAQWLETRHLNGESSSLPGQSSYFQGEGGKT